MCSPDCVRQLYVVCVKINLSSTILSTTCISNKDDVKCTFKQATQWKSQN